MKFEKETIKQVENHVTIKTMEKILVLSSRRILLLYQTLRLEPFDFRTEPLEPKVSTWAISLEQTVSMSVLLMFEAGSGFAAGSCVVHYCVFSSIPGLHFPDASDLPIAQSGQKCPRSPLIETH